jgi:hypothetical protein
MAEAVFSMFLVQVQDDFDIGAGLELVAAIDELPSKRLVVVDLSISHDCKPAVAAHKGLVATREIDDRQSSNTYRCRPILMDALIVGSPMLKRIEDQVYVSHWIAGPAYAGDPTHVVNLLDRPNRTTAVVRTRHRDRQALLGFVNPILVNCRQMLELSPKVQGLPERLSVNDIDIDSAIAMEDSRARKARLCRHEARHGGRKLGRSDR